MQFWSAKIILKQNVHILLPRHIAAQLCSNATQSVNGQLQWDTNSFADAAKKKGYSCNVAEIKEPVSCSSNPTACRDDEICALATKADSGVVQWQNNPKFRAHIGAAKNPWA